MQARLTVCALLAAAALCAPAAFAQPGDDRPPPRSPRPQAGDDAAPAQFDGSPEDAKRLLEDRLEDMRRRQTRLEQAIKRIDEGADPAEILRETEGGNRSSQRPDGPRRPFDGAMDQGPRGREDGPRGQGPGPLTPVERDRVRELIREHMPVLDAHLESIGPEGADRLINRMGPRLRDAEAIRRRDPKLFQLRVQELQGNVAMAQAVRSYRNALAQDPQSPKVAEATAQLRKLVEEQYELRLALQDREVEALSERLESMKADLEQKRSQRDTTIESMLSKIMDNTEFRDIKPGEREN